MKTDTVRKSETPATQDNSKRNQYQKNGPNIFKIKSDTRLVYGQAVTKLGRKHCITYCNTELKQHNTKFIFENNRAQE